MTFLSWKWDQQVSIICKKTLIDDPVIIEKSDENIIAVIQDEK